MYLNTVFKYNVFKYCPALDVTHYNGTNYLSLVDYGPSRFTIWQKLLNGTAVNIVANLAEIP